MATGIQMSKDIRVSYASWFSFQPGTVRVEKKLDAQNVAEVVREILEVQNKSETLGRVLKLPKVAVDRILQQYSNPQDRLLHIIDEFVKQVELSPSYMESHCRCPQGTTHFRTSLGSRD